MPTIDGAALNGTVVEPAGAGRAGGVAGRAAWCSLSCEPGVVRRLLLPVAVLAIVGARGYQSSSTAWRRTSALPSGARWRSAMRELTAQALAPGSTLACLDGAAGEAVENACEKTVFAGPQTTAAAVAYMAARLTLLADGLAFARQRDPDFAVSLAGLRRAIELDRFGIAAHVLAVRDGCTAERCAAFALLNDANVIKANLKAQVFDQYVSRYAGGLEQVRAGRRKAGAGRPGRQRSRAAGAGQGAGAEPIRVPVGRLDSAGQHHECRAEIAARRGRCPGRAAAAAAPPRSTAPPADVNVRVPPKRPQAQREQAAPPTPR